MLLSIFPSPNFDVRLVLRVVALDCRGARAALIDRDLLRRAVLTDRSAQEPQRRFAIPLGRQQEVHRGAGFSTAR